MRFGTGPVFAYEQLTAARRWQTYGLRVFGVGCVLAAMTAIASSQDALFQGREVKSLREYSALGTGYFHAIMGVELALVMLAAPAAVAGAICLDRSRGTLEHMLVTDLSDREIVLGKLAARMIPVLALLACSLPVLALSTLFGGIDLAGLLSAFVVVVTLAVFGCSLAMALSVWARKPHEVVMAMYALWATLVVLYPVAQGMARQHFIEPPPVWLRLLSPIYVTFARYEDPTAIGPGEALGFIVLTVRRLRASALRNRAAVKLVPRRQAENAGVRLPLVARILRWLPGPSLERNPVLWREWHRTRTPRVSLMLGSLTTMTIAACFVKGLNIWFIGTDWIDRSYTEFGGVYSYIVPSAFGMLILSATAPMSLSEERQRGSLDVLLATPLSTTRIVVAKWLSVFRVVPWLAAGPAVLCLAMANSTPLLEKNAYLNATIPSGERSYACLLLFAAIVAHGAFITSAGLALATWIRRQSVAIGLSVTLFVLIAGVTPILAQLALSAPSPPPSRWSHPYSIRLGNGHVYWEPGNWPASGTEPFDRRLRASLLSPVYASIWLVDELGEVDIFFRQGVNGLAIWLALVTVATLLLLGLTIATFNRCLGRMPEHGSRPRTVPRSLAGLLRRDPSAAVQATSPGGS
ncbi:MAG: ABC transporter permease [Isosphaeraceae bacterium]